MNFIVYDIETHDINIYSILDYNAWVQNDDV